MIPSYKCSVCDKRVPRGGTKCLCGDTRYNKNVSDNWVWDGVKTKVNDIEEKPDYFDQVRKMDKSGWFRNNH